MYTYNFILKELWEFGAKEKIEIFLVGGLLRDLLLGRQTVDYDVVINTDVEQVSRKFSKRIKGSFIVLDADNKIYRVVKKQKLKHDIEKGINIDFSQMRGKEIEDDLALRDFSIDAMAVKLNLKSIHTKQWYLSQTVLRTSNIRKSIIDPFGGTKDLAKGIIRAVDGRIFVDDPLRLLRAFRLAAILGFKIEPKTKKLINKYKTLIKKTAEERIHDEIIKILTTKNSFPYLLEADKVNLLYQIIPEIKPIKKAFRYYYHGQGLWGHSLDTLKCFEEIINNLSRSFPNVQDKLDAYLNEFIVEGIKRYSILKFAALFHDMGKPNTLRKQEGRVRFFGHEEEGIKLLKKIMLRLRFGTKEIRTVEKILRFHMRPGTLSQANIITDKAIWRFFRDTNGEGIGVLLVSLADYYAYRERKEAYDDILKHKRITRKIIYKYFLYKEIIKPKLLLNGTDIMNNFSLSQGPLIGKLLQNLEEAQVEGRIKNREEAFNFVRTILAV